MKENLKDIIRTSTMSFFFISYSHLWHIIQMLLANIREINFLTFMQHSMTSVSLVNTATNFIFHHFCFQRIHQNRIESRCKKSDILSVMPTISQSNVFLPQKLVRLKQYLRSSCHETEQRYLSFHRNSIHIDKNNPIHR